MKKITKSNNMKPSKHRPFRIWLNTIILFLLLTQKIRRFFWKEILQFKFFFISKDHKTCLFMHCQKWYLSKNLAHCFCKWNQPGIDKLIPDRVTTIQILGVTRVEWKFTKTFSMEAFFRGCILWKLGKFPFSWKFTKTLV